MTGNYGRRHCAKCNEVTDSYTPPEKVALRLLGELEAFVRASGSNDVLKFTMLHKIKQLSERTMAQSVERKVLEDDLGEVK